MSGIVQVGVVQYHVGAGCRLVLCEIPPLTISFWLMAKKSRIIIHGIALYGRCWYAAWIVPLCFRQMILAIHKAHDVQVQIIFDLVHHAAIFSIAVLSQ